MVNVDLLQWIIHHPNYQKNPLYIAGESFGGLIIPLIVDHVYNGNLACFISLAIKLNIYKSIHY